MKTIELTRQSFQPHPKESGTVFDGIAMYIISGRTVREERL